MDMSRIYALDGAAVGIVGMGPCSGEVSEFGWRNWRLGRRLDCNISCEFYEEKFKGTWEGGA